MSRSRRRTDGEPAAAGASTSEAESGSLWLGIREGKRAPPGIQISRPSEARARPQQHVCGASERSREGTTPDTPPALPSPNHAYARRMRCPFRPGSAAAQVPLRGCQPPGSRYRHHCAGAKKHPKPNPIQSKPKAKSKSERVLRRVASREMQNAHPSNASLDIADSRFQTADCRFQTADSRFTAFNGPLAEPTWSFGDLRGGRNDGIKMSIILLADNYETSRRCGYVRLGPADATWALNAVIADRRFQIADCRFQIPDGRAQIAAGRGINILRWLASARDIEAGGAGTHSTRVTAGRRSRLSNLNGRIDGTGLTGGGGGEGGYRIQERKQKSILSLAADGVSTQAPSDGRGHAPTRSVEIQIHDWGTEHVADEREEGACPRMNAESTRRRRPDPGADSGAGKGEHMSEDEGAHDEGPRRSTRRLASQVLHGAGAANLPISNSGARMCTVAEKRKVSAHAAREPKYAPNEERWRRRRKEVCRKREKRVCGWSRRYSGDGVAKKTARSTSANRTGTTSWHTGQRGRLQGVGPRQAGELAHVVRSTSKIVAQERSREAWAENAADRASRDCAVRHGTGCHDIAVRGDFSGWKTDALPAAARSVGYSREASILEWLQSRRNGCLDHTRERGAMHGVGDELVRPGLYDVRAHMHPDLRHTSFASITQIWTSGSQIQPIRMRTTAQRNRAHGLGAARRDAYDLREEPPGLRIILTAVWKHLQTALLFLARLGSSRKTCGNQIDLTQPHTAFSPESANFENTSASPILRSFLDPMQPRPRRSGVLRALKATDLPILCVRQMKLLHTSLSKFLGTT
ncbi:hypothetical protein B0H17DRAFT_1146361 [Mycena rosella]|uniref:Uncharacterized protein n=1 Tax=Mycena rosella TaxID=1033263 RepID=A0AAD7CP39_MYCRO|nr:hypothetical protein B0H17DRAFT_1146361 [Mycena rosella]